MSNFTIEDLFNYRRKGAGNLVDAYEKQQARIAELEATVERLREQLSAMAAQHRCGCGHPACNRCRDDADNHEALEATPQQNLNAVKRGVLLGLLSTMTCSECTCDRHVEQYANQRYPSDKDGE